MTGALAAPLLFCGVAAAQVALTPTPIQRFEDNNGNACSGCKVFTYAAGTTTKKATYTDSTGATSNTNPVILSTRGEAQIWMSSGAYKFVLSPTTDSDPPTNPIWTVDNIIIGPQSIVGGFVAPIQVSPALAQTSSRTTGGTFNFLQTDLSGTSTFSFPVDFSGIASIITATSGSTVNNINGIAAYLHNKSVSSGVLGPNAVAIMGQVTSEVSGANSWGTNLIMNDVASTTNVNMQNEFDCNVINPTTKCFGLVVTGTSTATPAASSALVVGPLNFQTPGSVRWTSGLWIEEAATQEAILISPSNKVSANVSSQTIIFQYYDGGSTLQNTVLGATGSGSLSFTSDVTATTTGIGIFNNFSGAANTGASMSLNTLSGASVLTNVQYSGSQAGLIISSSFETGGMEVFGSAGSNGGVVITGNPVSASTPLSAPGQGILLDAGTGGTGGVSLLGRTGGISITPGTGGLSFLSLGTTPGGKSYLCIDESNGRIYGATGPAPGTC